jgi:hypothetical protein
MYAAINQPDVGRGPPVVKYGASKLQDDELRREGRVVRETYYLRSVACCIRIGLANCSKFLVVICGLSG